MVHIICASRRWLLGVAIGGLLVGGSLLHAAEALAGISTSPGSRIHAGPLMTRCATGAHVKEVTIEHR